MCQWPVQVIVWSSQGQRVSIFQHSQPVIALAFSRTIGQLASATTAEFAVWSADDTPVKRQKVCSSSITFQTNRHGSTVRR